MTDDSNISGDIRLRFGVPNDFVALRSLREAVFCDELGIQERSYHDVISDWHSKNIVLVAGERLIGAVRLAYLREWQEYYVSYLCLAEAYRRKAHLRMLFGALILLMKHNGIASIRADSADANLPMYRAMGCVPIGVKFRKPGFVCEWTPMRYQLGVNAVAELGLAERAAAHFEQGVEGNLSSGLTWSFDTTFHLCDTMSAFQATFEKLLKSDRIPGHLPHLTPLRRSVDLPQHETFVSDARTIEVCPDGMEFLPDAPTMSLSGPACPDRPMVIASGCFSDLNNLISSRNLLVVLADSDASSLARLYAILTKKHLVELNDWEELPDHCRPGVVSATAILGPTDPAPSRSVLSDVLRSCAIGVLTAADLPALSSRLLGSYLHFIGPTQCAITVQPLDLASYRAVTSGIGRALGPAISSFTAGQEKVAIVLGPYHVVIAPAGICRLAVTSISVSLEAGCTIGQAVRLAGAEQRGAEPMLLVGDPALRLDLAPSEGAAQETRQLAAVSE